MQSSTKVAMALGAVMGLSALFGSASGVQAQEASQCLPSAQAEEILSDYFGQQQSGSGAMRGGAELQLYTDEQGGFNLVVENGAETCLQSMGTALIDTDEVEMDFVPPRQELTMEQMRAISMMVQGSQGSCMEPSSLFNLLSTRYQEEPRLVGRGVDGSVVVLLDTPDGALQLDGEPSADTWTVVSIRKNHPNIDLEDAYSACMVAGGENWTDIEVDPDAVVGPRTLVGFTPN